MLLSWQRMLYSECSIAAHCAKQRPLAVTLFTIYSIAQPLLEGIVQSLKISHFLSHPNTLLDELTLFVFGQLYKFKSKLVSKLAHALVSNNDKTQNDEIVIHNQKKSLNCYKFLWDQLWGKSQMYERKSIIIA